VGCLLGRDGSRGGNALAVPGWRSLRGRRYHLVRVAGSAAHAVSVAFFYVGALVTGFYSVIPAVFMAITPTALQTRFLKPALIPDVQDLLSGPAELMILQFASMCFTGLAAAAALARPRPNFNIAALSAERDIRAACAAFGDIVLLFAFLVLKNVTDGGTGWLALEASHAMAPSMAITYAVLCYGARRAPIRLGALALGGAGLVAAGLLTTGAAKAPIYILLSGAMFIAVTTSPRKLAVLGLAASATVMVPLIFIVLSFVRGTLTLHWDGGDFRVAQGEQKYSSPVLLANAVTSKLVVRQAETLGCLQNVFAQHLAPGTLQAESTPFYFVEAVVPRLLWPNKPSFSLGQDYATTYCRIKPREITPGTTQSNSITLLGQPLIKAGIAGVVVAQMTIALLFIGATIASLSHRPAVRIAIVALLPWMIDFDQSFALYIANLLKMLLIMLPALMTLDCYMRRGRQKSL
jgi:hypothetical protein